MHRSASVTLGNSVLIFGGYESIAKNTIGKVTILGPYLIGYIQRKNDGLIKMFYHILYVMTLSTKKTDHFCLNSAKASILNP